MVVYVSFSFIIYMAFVLSMTNPIEAGIKENQGCVFFLMIFSRGPAARPILLMVSLGTHEHMRKGKVYEILMLFGKW